MAAPPKPAPSSLPPGPAASRRFSRWSGGLRVGPGYLERTAPASAAILAPRGLVDALADLAGPGIDVAQIHPGVAPFFNDPASLLLHIESRWRFPFNLWWTLFRPVFRWMGQLVLPATSADVVARVVGIDREADGRADARGVLRSYAGTGGREIMQVMIYATWARPGSEGQRYMSVALPLPLGHLAALMRLGSLGADAEGKLAVELSSTRRSDDAGIHFVLFGRVPVRVPLSESLSLFPPSHPGKPADLEPSAQPGTTLVARHEQRLCGIRLVTHDYWFRPLVGGDDPSSDRGAPP